MPEPNALCSELIFPSKVLVAFDREIPSHMSVPEGRWRLEMQMFAFYIGWEEFTREETLDKWAGAHTRGQL